MPPLAPRFCRFRVRSRKHAAIMHLAISRDGHERAASERIVLVLSDCLEMEISAMIEASIHPAITGHSRKSPNRNEIACQSVASPLARLVVLVIPAICDIHDPSILAQNEKTTVQSSGSPREATIDVVEGNDGGPRSAIGRASIDDAHKKIPSRQLRNFLGAAVRLERIQIQMSLGHGRV